MMLVAYFSASGRTARLAQTIAQAAQADLYEIRPAQPYTSADLNWHDAHSRSSVEMKDPACRPAIAGDLPDLSRYDTILVGFPIWWYQAPRIVETFVASCDFSGKTVIPFATSGEAAWAVLRRFCKRPARPRPAGCPAGVWTAAQAWTSSGNG